MIFLTKGQVLIENPNMVVCSPTGYYNDGDSVICAPGFAPDEPACRYEAQFIAYGGVVYSISDPDQLMAEIMKIDPKTLFGKDSQQVAVDKAIEQIVPQDPDATDTATTTPPVTTPPVVNPTSTTTPITATTTPITLPDTSTTTPITGTDTSTTTPITGTDTSTTTPITGTSTPPITGTSTPPGTGTGTSTPPGTGTSTPPGTGGDNGTSTPPGNGGGNGTSTPPDTGGNGTSTPPTTASTTDTFLNAINTIINPNPVSTTTPIQKVIDIITSSTTE